MDINAYELSPMHVEQTAERVEMIRRTVERAERAQAIVNHVDRKRAQKARTLERRQARGIKYLMQGRA